MTRPNGAVFYEGPSQLTGHPIVGIVTGLNRRSRNDKTGPMLQTWFLRQDMSPLEALGHGLDDAVCGRCSLRHRICYVQIGQAPSGVWKAWAAGSYPEMGLGDFVKLYEGESLRWGAYGDPLSVPMGAVRAQNVLLRAWTGYTHQWTHLRGKITTKYWQSALMASCETEEQAETAQAAGWRTFRVKAPSARRLPREKPCPAGPRGSKVQCITCPSPCNGGDGPSIVIDVHGSGAGSLPAGGK